MCGMAKKRLTFSDELRRAIEGCGKTRYEISKETGIDQAILSRFMHGKGGLSMPNLDTLAELLGWHVATEGSKQKGK